jgi:SAM-dependent methyltransferase
VIRDSKTAADPYSQLPELYDLEHAGFADDVELYLQFAEVIGDPILELGCGTGRVVVPLAKAGHRVTGVDQSVPMLDRAREIVASAGVSHLVDLHEGAMTAADNAPSGPFGLAIFSLNGLMHLPTPAEQRAALEGAKRALDPRGMLVIDTQNPTPDWLATFGGQVQHEGTWERHDGSVVNRFSTRTHSLVEQRIDTELWYDIVDAHGGLNRVRTKFPMRYLVPSELALILELVGFVEWKFYGSYELDPFDSGSERLIVTAELTPS